MSSKQAAQLLVAALVGVAAFVALAVGGCEQPGIVTCSAALVCPPGTQCAGARCATDEEVVACAGVEDGLACQRLDGLCQDGACRTNLCGNGVLETYPVSMKEEACDQAEGLLACADVGSDFGLTSCDAQCTFDDSACESFAWQRVRSGPNAVREVVVSGDATFLAYPLNLAWREAPGQAWLQAAAIPSNETLGDIVPLSAEDALVVTRLNAQNLRLWSFHGPSKTVTKTGLGLSISAGQSWNGGVALDAQTVLGSVGEALVLLRRTGDTWRKEPLTVSAACAGVQRVQWAATAAKVYALVDTRVVQLDVDLPNLACTDVRDLGKPGIALGGRGARLEWAVDVDGGVYDAATWTLRNSEPTETFALDSAVVQYVDDTLRAWATRGPDVLVFEGGSWWKSLSGAAVVRDTLGDTLAPHRPLAVLGRDVLAAQNSKDAGLVQRNDREWLLGWQSGGRKVTDVLVDGRQRPWTLLATGELSIASRTGVLTPALTAPLTAMVRSGEQVLIGARDGVFRLGEDFAVTRVGDALTGVKGVWSAADGTLYAATNSSLYRKPPGLPTWEAFVSIAEVCPVSVIEMIGGMVAGAPRIFVTCRAYPNTEPQSVRLVIYDPDAGSSTFVTLPNNAFQQLAVTSRGEVWAMAAQKLVRVMPPYLEADVEEIRVERKNPANNKLEALNEQYTDVEVTAGDDVYLSADRQNLFAWDGARMVRVSSSRGSTTAYLALASFGAQLYAAYEGGIDMLFRDAAR